MYTCTFQKRTGLLAQRVKKPFSVIHTSSLANINQAYSPEKKTSKPATKSNGKNTAVSIVERSTSETKQQLGRREQTQRKENLNVNAPNYRGAANDKFKAPLLENCEMIGAAKTTEIHKAPKAPGGNRKKMRRSNTYSEVSGLGLVVPIIHNEEVTGHKDTSILDIDECDISIIAAETQKLPTSELPSFMDENEICSKVRNIQEPSFLITEQVTETKTSTVFESVTQLKQAHDQYTTSTADLEPSFLVENKAVGNMKNENDFQDSLDTDSNRPPIEEPSFLVSDDKPRRFLRRQSSPFATENVEPASKDLNGDYKIPNSKPSKRKSWNRDAIQQSHILAQLKSFEIECSASDVSNEEEGIGTSVDRRETFVASTTSPRFSMPATGRIHRGTFVVNSKKQKLLQSQKSFEGNPFRTSFTVLNDPFDKPNQLPSKSHVTAVLMEEEDSGSIPHNTVKSCSNQEPSFLIEEQVTETKASLVFESVTQLKQAHDQYRTSTADLEPSFLEQHMKNDLQDSLDTDNNRPPIEEPSFLVSDDKPRRSLSRKSGPFATENGESASLKLLRGVKKMSSKPAKSAKRKSWNRDTSQQSPVLAQLKKLRSFIHDKSLEIENSGSESSNEDQNILVDSREAVVRSVSSPTSAMSIKFVTDSTKHKLLESQKPSEASPRRTTFTVVDIRTSKPSKLPTESNQPMAIMEEDIEGSILAESVNDLNNAANQEIDDGKNVEESGQGCKKYSVDSLENDSFQVHNISPQMIQCHEDEFTSKTTLTVTKVRSSDALLENFAKQKNLVTTALFQQQATAEEDCNHHSYVNKGDTTSSQNSTFEVSADKSILVKEADFQSTPHHLPTSPSLNHSRPSTHTVAQHKVVNMSNIATKQLFVPELPINAETPTLDEFGMSQENENKNGVSDYSSPSANTRRRTLSAKRKSTSRLSVAAVEEMAHIDVKVEAQTIANKGFDQTDAETDQKQNGAEGLFFIPFDKSDSDSKTERRDLVTKPDPRQYLKKRSNSETQRLDVQPKKVCSVHTASAAFTTVTRGVRQTTKLQGKLCYHL